MTEQSSNLIDQLKSIFRAGLHRVDPIKIIENKLKLDGDILSITNNQQHHIFDLSQFDKIYVIGAGKASARMALAVERILKEKITAGIISTKYGHEESLSRIKIIEAGHPVPDENSLKASGEILDLCKKLTEKSLVISLISGGGSALLSLPVKEITHEDKQKVTQTLLACGADICEINCIRKHLSAIKGGRLVQAIAPATSLNLILSDVIGDRLDSIASGLTANDETSFKDALEIIDKYEIAEQVPEKVMNYLKKGLGDGSLETPKQDNSIFIKNHNFIIGSNIAAVEQAAAKAKEMNYNTIVLSSQIMGEARTAAANYAGICMDIKRRELLAPKPACIIAGGETTVTIKGNGKGGRNQEMALAFLQQITDNPEALKDVYFLSAATDGNDGPTDAAGGFACLEMTSTDSKTRSQIKLSLDNNDAYHYLKKNNLLYVTGPTNTNVCDLQIMIIL